jgi:hypothetical protein
MEETRMRPTLALIIAAALASVGWTTGTHVGYQVNDQSTTGFRETGGSLGFLDVAQTVTDGVDLGVRTLGQGGRLPDRQFYRLAAGPLVVWQMGEGWSLQASAGMFQESGLRPDGSKLYGSRGTDMMLGWEKSYQLSPRAEVAWGGFVTRYQGGLSAAAVAPGAAPTSGLGSRNTGMAHGLEAALKVEL